MIQYGNMPCLFRKMQSIINIKDGKKKRIRVERTVQQVRRTYDYKTNNKYESA